MRRGFGWTFSSVSAPLHAAAHSHHPWPDVTFAAQEAAWREAARFLDRKWDHVFDTILPLAQSHVARLLGLPDPASVAFGPNTHSFVVRLLSCLPAGRPVRILTTSSEFMSFARQIGRLEEDELAVVTRVPTEPFDTFETRFADAAAEGDYDLVFFSHVFFDSGFAIGDVAKIVAAVRNPETFVVIDGYHAFMALPVDIAAVAERAFYLAGGYKYAMAGEGCCFLHCPPGYGMRPRNTGWYAGFAALQADTPGIGYARDGSRFLGATFDVTALYRFNAVQEWFAREGLTVQNMLEYVRAIEHKFLDALNGASVSREMLVVQDEARRGRFLAFATRQAGRIMTALDEANIIVDHRGDRLRIGFGIYHDPEDATRLARALAAL